MEMTPKPRMLVPGSIPNIILSIVNPVESCVWTENLRDDDSVFGLIVLEEGGHDTRKSERTSVQSVAELGLAILVTIAEVQSVCLVGLEVGD